MFKNRTVQMKVIKDADDGAIGTDYVTAIASTEAAVNRVIDHAVKAAVTIIVVKTASELFLKCVK